MLNHVAKIREHELVCTFKRHLVISFAAVNNTLDVAAFEIRQSPHVALHHQIYKNSHHTFAATRIFYKTSLLLFFPI